MVFGKNTRTYEHGIFFSSALNIVDKIIWMLVSVGLAFFFGANPETDVFFFVFAGCVAVTAFITRLNIAVLLPEFVRQMEQVGRSESQAFINFFICVYVLLAAGVSGIIFFAPYESLRLISHFSNDVIGEQVYLIKLIALLCPLMVAEIILAQVVRSMKYFSLPVVIGLAKGILVLTTVMLYSEHGLKWVVYTYIVYFSAAILFYISFLIRAEQWAFFKLRPLPSPKVLKNILMGSFGSGTAFFSSMAPAFLFSGIGGGHVSCINYAQKILGTSSSITMQFNQISGIRFNEVAAKREYDKFDHVFQRGLGFLFYLVLAFSCLLFILGREITEVIYYRGEFSQESFELTSLLVRLLAISMPFAVVMPYLGHLLRAAQHVKVFVLYQVFLNVTKIILLFVNIKFFQVLGFPLAIIELEILNLIFSRLLLKKYFNHVNFDRVAAKAIKNLVINWVIGALVYLLNNIVIEDSSALIKCLLGAGIYFMLLTFATFTFNMNPDAERYFRRVKSILRV